MERLLVVSEPGVDGVFACVRSLIEYLHRRHPEIRVDLAYSSRRAGGALPGLVAAVERRGGETLDLRVGNSPEFRDFAAAAALLQWMRRRRIQLVHAHSSKAGALARLGALVPGFPPVLYSPNAYFGMPRLGGKKEFFFNGIESLLGRLAPTHNCSEDERDFAIRVLKLNPSSLHVIHHGIDLERFSPADAETRARLRRELGLPAEARLLVTVGRASVQKNYGPLYAALDGFLPGSGAAFAHAGNGSVELRQSLSPAARSSAFAFHYLDQPEALLRAADGFILTSRYEGLSFSMLQAFGCGLPAILAEAPGLRVAKALGFSGVRWLPDPVRAADVRRALEEWNRSAGAAGNSRELALHYFSESRQLEEMIGLYRRLI
ncbi:MAG TPA: glycosyltransferase family 4 protein [Chthoniobacterales bacterium]